MMDHPYTGSAGLMVNALRESGPLTAYAIRCATGLHSNGVADSLKHAINNGHVRIVMVPTRTGLGRPHKYYEWVGESGAKPKAGTACTTRPCMCCQRKFPSAGPHNRLCNSCRKKDVSPYAL